LDELIPNLLIKNTIEEAETNYGKKYDITDQKILKVLDESSEKKATAGYKAYIDKKAAGASEDEIAEAVQNAMNEPGTVEIETAPVILKKNRALVPEKAQKTYRKYENMNVLRNDYKLNIADEIPNDHPVVIWATAILKKNNSMKHIEKYRKQQLLKRSLAVYQSQNGTVSPGQVDKANKGAQEPFYDENNIDISKRKYVACLHKTIEHIVVIPPFHLLVVKMGGTFYSPYDILLRILIDLYDLNVLEIEQSSNECKINKRVALIFSNIFSYYLSLYRDLYNLTELPTNLYDTFIITSTLELTNTHNIFVLSNSSYAFPNEENKVIEQMAARIAPTDAAAIADINEKSILNALKMYDMSKLVGVSILNKFYTGQRASEKIEIPTLLSPTHVLFPYKLKHDMDGVVISYIYPLKPKQDDYTLKKLYSNPSYGSPDYGLYVDDDFNFVYNTTRVIRYNFDINNDFIGKLVKFHSGPEFGIISGLTGNNGQPIYPTYGQIPPALNGTEFKNFIDTTIKGLYHLQNNTQAEPDEQTRNRYYLAIVASIPEFKLYLKRGLNIAKWELSLALQKGIVKLIEEINKITESANKETPEYKKKVFKIINISPTEYIDYLRYPLTARFEQNSKRISYTYPILNTIVRDMEINREDLDARLNQLGPTFLNRIYEEPEFIRPPQAGGGLKPTKSKRRKILVGGANCGQTQVFESNRRLGIFDVEQMAPYTIMALSFVKDEEMGTLNPICSIENTMISGTDKFTKWPDNSQIADISNLVIIDIGEKTYAIRNADKAQVKNNWMGYIDNTIPELSGGGNKLSEYEEQYDTLINQITTTLGDVQETIRGNSFVGGAIPTIVGISSLSTYTSTISTYISTISTSTLRAPIYYTFQTKITRKDGKTYNFILKSTDTILDLKILIERETGVPVSQQHIFKRENKGTNTPPSPTTTSPLRAISSPLSTIGVSTMGISTTAVLHGGGCPTKENNELTNEAAATCAGDSANMYTTDELSDKAWVPAVIAATVGVIGLAAMRQDEKELQKNVDVNDVNNGLPPQGGQQPTSVHKHNTPILTEGEAELLNDLNLTPVNMKKIFNTDNEYYKKFQMKALNEWGTAIAEFLDRLSAQSCYNNSLMLTKSECDIAKCFLYSIRNYLDRPEVNAEIQTGILMNEDSFEFNEPSLEHDTKLVLSEDSFEMPKYRTEDKIPYVSVGAIEKKTNNRLHFKLKLDSESRKKDTDSEPTNEEKEALNAKFEEIKRKYAAKYVMYLY
jgi:hypothetical protein